MHTRRALLVSDVKSRGGVSTHLNALVRHAVRGVWRIDVLLDATSGMNATAHALRAAGAAVHRARLHPCHAGDAEISDLIRRTLDDLAPHVVHVHNGSPRSALVARETVIASGVPLFFTEHFVPPAPPPDAIVPRLRDLYRQAAGVIFVCEANRAALRDGASLTTARGAVIHNGVMLPAQPASARSGSPRSAVSVARLSHEKGIDVLLEAAARLRGTVAEPLRFSVFGAGGLERDLRRLAGDLGVDGAVDFKGWVDDPPSHLASYQLFVLPSRAEGQPIALLDALAFGLPCVATAVAGIPEALGHGEFGRLVTPDDPEALAAAIVSHCENPAILLRKAAAARPYLQTRHDMPTNAGRILDLWTQAAVRSGQ